MEISESAWAKAKEHVDAMPPLPPFKHQVQEAIARAIDQERRECAEIANSWASDVRNGGNTRIVASKISQAIRNK